MTSEFFTFRKSLTFVRLLILLCAFSIQASAHDCFLMAKPFRLQQGGATLIAIHIGELFPAKHVAWNPDRITRFHQWHGRTLINSVVPEPLEDSSGVSVRDVVLIPLTASNQPSFHVSNSVRESLFERLHRRSPVQITRKDSLFAAD